MATVKYFPVPAAKNVRLVSSFCRRYIPGTSRLYERAKSGCVKKGKCAAKPGHCATDIVYTKGATIRACHPGKIRLRSFGPAFGKQVTIVAGDGTGFFHAHLDKVYVKEGQTVHTGDKIGTVGETGQTGGPHLHFEKRIRWDDWCTAVDAYPELVAAQKA